MPVDGPDQLFKHPTIKWKKLPLSSDLGSAHPSKIPTVTTGGLKLHHTYDAACVPNQKRHHIIQVAVSSIKWIGAELLIIYIGAAAHWTSNQKVARSNP